MAIIGRDCLVLSIGADTDILCYNSQTITQTLAGEIPPTDIFSQDPGYLLHGELEVARLGQELRNTNNHCMLRLNSKILKLFSKQF